VGCGLTNIGLPTEIGKYEVQLQRSGGSSRPAGSSVSWVTPGMGGYGAGAENLPSSFSYYPEKCICFFSIPIPVEFFLPIDYWGY